MAEGVAAMAIHGFSPELVEEGQEIIDAYRKGETAPLVAYKDFTDFCVSHGICELDAQVKCKDVLCHPKNRHEMGLNGFQCHQNGDGVLTIGCSPNEMARAAVIEICPLPGSKQVQIDFNLQQVERAGSMLAEVQGTEKYLSLACGHLFAFGRAALYGCKTPIKRLQDQQGCVSLELIRRKDKRFAALIEDSAKARKFKWQVEVAWPGFPDMAQRALNASLEVHGKSNELEVMRCIALFDEGRVADQQFSDVVNTVSQSMPPYVEYIDKVGQLAVLCGGGPGAPFVSFMDRFSKRFSENKVLGAEFVTAVAEVKFNDIDKFVMCRIALILGNLVSTKAVDGIAKCFVKTDVKKLGAGTCR